MSYGGVSAGTRAVNSLKNDLATFRTVPLAEGVNFPFFNQYINDNDEFVADEKSHVAAKIMLKELIRWTKGLQIIKAEK